MSRTSVRFVAPAILAAAAIALAITAAIFYATGGRWYTILTPSMGETAPVGTLVLTAPAADIRTGDIISFHPPTSPTETYTHRVHDITPAGIHTKGDLNGAVDPWTLAPADLTGRATAVIPAGGWLAQGLPLIAVGATIIWLAAGRLRSATTRTVTRLVGIPLVVTAVTAFLHPLIGVIVESTTGTTDGTEAAIVSTGILPTTVTMPGAHPVHLAYGQLGTIHTTAVDHAGLYQLTSGPNFTSWQMGLVLALCTLPLVAAVIAGIRLNTREVPVA